MKINTDLKKLSLLTLRDLTDREMIELLDLADALKKRKNDGIRGKLLHRMNIAMVFEKTSTRTRCATSVAASDEGGRGEYLAAHDIHLGGKESVPDTARVLGRMFDGILFRGFKQSTVDDLAKFSGIPVWNGLTDDAHPTQTLADLMTIREYFEKLQSIRVVYVGDGRNNVANSLMLGCVKAGMHFVNCTPPELMPDTTLIAEAEEIAAKNGGSVTIDSNPVTAVKNANVIYSDVWVSMGEEDKKEERIKLLMPYQIDMNMMKNTGNLESENIIFLHCLPAFHDTKTEVSKETGALEVTDDVFESKESLVFDLAENRMHTIKAIMVAALGNQDEIN